MAQGMKIMRMRAKQRVLAKRYQLDTSFIISYLQMSEMSFYGRHISMWINEDLLWKEEVSKDVETLICHELLKIRGK